MASRYIPDPVLEDILKTLPVKSLLRFRAVSKSWDTIITKSCFILRHMECNRNINPCLLVQEEYANHVQCFSLKNVVEDRLHEHMSVVFGSSTNVLVGACRGLLCLKTDKPGIRQDRFAILNPSIKRLIHLQRPHYPSVHRLDLIYRSVIGFGFDTNSDDFKIVRIAYENKIPLSKSLYVEIFSLKEKKWKSKGNRPSSCRFQSESTLLCGKVHWVAKDKGLVIEVFDLTHEKFSTLALPECFSNSPLLSISMTSTEGSLLLLQRTTWELWVMTEYADANSWTKLRFIESSNMEHLGFRKEVTWTGDGQMILGYWKRGVTYHKRATGTENGQIILQLGDLLLYLFKEGEVQQIQHQGISENGKIINFKRIVNSYTESLMLLNSDGFFEGNLSNGWVELSLESRSYWR